MDIFQHRYYRLGKILMSLTGQWPYQSNHIKRGILVGLLLFLSYQAIDQPVTIVKYRYDWNVLMGCFTPNVFDAVCAAKYFGFMFNSHKILKLLDRIRSDWHVWARHREVKILHEYAERGEKISIVYAAMVYFAIFIFTTQPMITKLVDIVTMNGTAPGKFAFPVTYSHVNVQKYYFYLSIYCTICVLIITTVLISSEVMLILYVQHVCGILAAVGHIVEQIGRNYTSEKTGGSLYALDKANRVHLASCIDRHNDAMEYADLIESSYAWNLFFTLGFGMILINAFGLQILLRNNDLGATLTFISATLGTVFVFYVECHISQILIDHSISIRFYIQNSEWYRLLPKTQKIVQLMTMRCDVPCHLTVGNMLIMSMQSFGLTLRTTMSYFAFVRSLQGV